MFFIEVLDETVFHQVLHGYIDAERNIRTAFAHRVPEKGCRLSENGAVNSADEAGFLRNRNEFSGTDQLPVLIFDTDGRKRDRLPGRNGSSAQSPFHAYKKACRA